MKNLKKAAALLLALVMVLSLCACGNGGQGTTTKASEEGKGKDFKVALVIGVGGLGDGSFNDILKSGLDQAVEKYGLPEYQLIQPTEVAEFEGHYTDLCASKEYDLIVGGGYDAIDTVAKVAAEFPDQKFLFVDGEVAGLDNVKSVTYRDNEKTFLLGMLAAMTTKTNKLGLVLAFEIPSLVVFGAGFMAGAYYVNPDIQVDVKTVGSFSDTTTAKELALSLYDDGADIIYAAAGGSGLGVFTAAEERGLYAIGTDTNQCPLSPDHIIASGMRLMDVTIVNGIGEAIDGTMEGGAHTEGLKEGALAFTVEGSNVPASEEAIKAANEALEKIKSGEIKAPTTWEEAAEFKK